MSHAEECDRTSWYAVRTHPKQEERASDNLLAWGGETLLPRIRDCHYNQFTGARVYTIKPLFPRYIFARFQASALLHKIRFTRGVHSVVSFGDRPVSVDDEVIAVIKARMQKDGVIEIGEQFSPGEQVLIKEGPFKNLVGIFERSISASDRVMILLNTITYQGHISLERDLITRHAQTGASHATRGF
ncbi:MAG TPA: transcription termination/antitermination NusG family protein [Pyrinomonadaceae bacterium]|jgi:transcriptional antiterminator RfaH